MTSSPCSALVTDPIFLWVQPHPPVVAQLCNPFRLSCKYHAFQLCTDHTNRLIDQKNLPIVRRLIAVARARDVASYFRTDSPYLNLNGKNQSIPAIFFFRLSGIVILFYIANSKASRRHLFVESP